MTAPLPHDPDGRRRVVIERVRPEIDGGRWPAKRVIGERVVVEADIFADGHDLISAVVRWRRTGSERWTESAMAPRANDRWRGEFTVDACCRYEFTLSAWIDHFKTWHRDLQKRIKAGQDVAVEMLVAAGLIEQAAGRAPKDAAAAMKGWAAELRADRTLGEKLALVNDPLVQATVLRHPRRELAVDYGKVLEVQVDPVKARFSSWYELFPRSAAAEPGRHGTFADVERKLPEIARMGFDVLYFPPIHPIGRVMRKGPNNTLEAGPDDPGSPWAIGSREGGHKSIHPKLGTEEDFRRLVAKARKLGIDVALDIALQCAPDHPYVKEHPEWFQHRPDGTVQYAENPPKKYQDIYPFDFLTDAWQELWLELLDIFMHWCRQGVRVFRVDNPHTKPFPLWDWIIDNVKREYPEAIFLAEAFTRPKIMHRLAKGGFTQSYTYFAWRNSKWGLEQYLTELTKTEVADFFRPNFWPNTPDILNDYLQTGGRPAFVTRLILAATLGASYGIYGPAYELIENSPREPGSEEYLDSEKYQLRQWDEARPDSLRDLVTMVNRIRREQPALQSNEGLCFHATNNEHVICYSKATPDLSNIILCAVNLDPFATQAAWLTLDGDALGLDDDSEYQVHDLVGQERFRWKGLNDYVELNPWVMPAHVFLLRRRVRSERDFEYFL